MSSFVGPVAGPVRAGESATGATSPAERYMANLVDTAASNSTDLAQARRAVAKLLAAAGVKTVSSPARVPLRPRAVRYVVTAGVDAMVDEVRTRSVSSRQTLAEYAAFLMPTTRSPRATSGTRLRDFLAAWLAVARSRPDLPGSNAIFALNALAQRQNPRLNVSWGGYDPSELRLGFLDLTLLHAGLAQTAAIAFDLGAAKSPVSTPEQHDARTVPGPCDTLAEDLERMVPPVPGGLANDIRGSVPKAAKPAVQQLAKRYVKYIADDAATASGTIVKRLGEANRLTKMIELAQTYRLAHASAEVLSDNPIHRPQPGGVLNTAVKVTFGIPDDQWAAAGHSNVPQPWSDCLKMVGMPYPTTTRDVAAELAKWQVEWRISGPDVVRWHGPGVGTAGLLFTDQLIAENDHTAAVTRQFELVEEVAEGHPGTEVTDDVTITARLFRPATPDLSTLLTAVLSGGPAAAFDYTLKSFSMLFPKQVSVVLHVTHHEHIGRPHRAARSAQWNGYVVLRHHATKARHRSLPGAKSYRNDMTVTQDDWSSVIQVTGVASNDGDTTRLNTSISSAATHTVQDDRWSFARITGCTAVRRRTSNAVSTGSTSTTDKTLRVVIDGAGGVFRMRVPLVVPATAGQVSRRDSYVYRGRRGECADPPTGARTGDVTVTDETTARMSLSDPPNFWDITDPSILPDMAFFRGTTSGVHAGRLITAEWELWRSE
ncbi:hypothetical protein GCM10010166_27080 [Couchioplanes caeruleus subsp. azureus]|nr:hypothetical protein GCM10010166_27080 [Couchioplanes caeruleus subsp. azureus]